MMNIKQNIMNMLPYGIVQKYMTERPAISGDAPEIYNSKGERILIAYLQDIHILHSPYTYTSGRNPQRILWDRVNSGLRTQFYSHQDICHRQKKSDNCKQFGILVESENVVPDDYDMLLKQPDVVNSLDLLFTHSDRLLDKYPNARFIPGGCPWYGSSLHGGGNLTKGRLKTRVN